MDTNPAPKIPQLSPTAGMLVEIGELRPLLDGTLAALGRQRDALQTRGFGMPNLTIESMEGLLDALNQFEDLLKSEQQEVAQLRQLADNAAALSSSFDLSEILNEAMDAIIHLSGAERGGVILTDPLTGDLDFRVIRDADTITNRPAASDDVDRTSQFSRSIIRDVLESGEALISHNAPDDSRLSGAQSVINLDIRSVLCVPLQNRDSRMGVVYVDNRLKRGVFRETEKNLLTAFSNQVSVAVANARLFADLQTTLAEITRVGELTDNVFNSLNSGILTADSLGSVLRLNDRTAELLSYDDPLSLVGMPTSTLLGPIAEPLQAAMNRVHSTEQAETFEVEIPLSDKARATLNIKLSPLQGESGASQGTVMVMDDVTQQRDRAETFRMLKWYLPPAMVDNIQTIAQLGFSGERREVTCVFVDTRTQATLRDGARPREIMERVNVFLSRATDIVHESGGVVDKYMGTEIMVLFNTQLNPMAHHAAAAIDAALTLRQAFEVIYSMLKLPVKPGFFRIGVHTGIATLGNVGSHSRRDFTALGDSINLSKRLQENAQDGQIILSEETRQHAEANPLPKPGIPWQYVPRGNIHAKGRTQQTPVYEVFSE
jgi:adenylate cyclase